jgi:hypothetical protein
MLTLVAKLRTNSDIREFFENILAKKATGTLMKRAGSLIRFLTYCKRRGVSGLPFTEEVCYEYCETAFGDTEAFKPTSTMSFKEAVAFAGYCLQFDNVQEILQSKRLQGLVYRMVKRKRKLKQSEVFTVEEMRILMMVVC